MNSVSVIVFLVSALSCGLFLLRDDSDRKIFKVPGAVTAILVVSSFFLSWLSIPLTLWAFSAIFAVVLVSSALFERFVRRKETADITRNLHPTVLFKPDLLTCIIFACALVIAVAYFRGSLQTPQYFSIDAATHHVLENHLEKSRRLLFFEESLYLPDSRDIGTYPFGTSVAHTVFSDIMFFMENMAAYQLFNILLYAVVATYFFVLFVKKLKLSDSVSIALFALLTLLGFFLNILIVGFISQLLGIFMVLVFFDLYRKPISIVRAALLGVLLSAVLFTYIYWLPVLMVFLAVANLDLLSIKQLKENIPHLFRVLMLSGVFALISLPFILRMIRISILGYADDDGMTYKVFLLNFILFAPFIILALDTSLQTLLKRKRPLESFLIAPLVYTGLLYIGYRFRVISQYTLGKSFYLAGPVLYALSVFGIDRANTLLKKSFKISLSFVYLAIFLFVLFMTPVQRNTQCLQPNDIHSFDSNTLGLDGKLFDLYYQNLIALITDDHHPVNLDKDRQEFLKNFKQYLPDPEMDKITVITDFDSAMWFYGATGVWPRSLEEQKFIYTFGITSYDLWKEHDASRLLIFLGGPITQDWVKENEFEIEDFDVLYQVGTNLLMQEKSS